MALNTQFPFNVFEITEVSDGDDAELLGPIEGALDFDGQLSAGESVIYAIWDKNGNYECGETYYQTGPSRLQRSHADTNIIFSTTGSKITSWGGAHEKNVAAVVSAASFEGLIKMPQTLGWLVRTAADTYAARTLPSSTPGAYIVTTNGDGAADDPVFNDAKIDSEFIHKPLAAGLQTMLAPFKYDVASANRFWLANLDFAAQNHFDLSPDNVKAGFRLMDKDNSLFELWIQRGPTVGTDLRKVSITDANELLVADRLKVWHGKDQTVTSWTNIDTVLTGTEIGPITIAAGQSVQMRGVCHVEQQQASTRTSELALMRADNVNFTSEVQIASSREGDSGAAGVDNIYTIIMDHIDEDPGAGDYWYRLIWDPDTGAKVRLIGPASYSITYHQLTAQVVEIQ